MVLRLDPRFALVWRDPFSLQIGVDPAQVILREVTTGEERMIAALAGGVSRSGLDMIAETAGLEHADVAGLLRRLRPLLAESAPAAERHRVSIIGVGRTVDRLAHLLALAGVQVSISRAAGDDIDGELGVLVSHYVLEPESYGFWLRRDRPHLPVVFGDDSVLMGPVVDPGRTACLYCLEHFRRDADASWPAIASQLWGRRSAAETPLVSAEVAVRVARMVLNRLSGAAAPGRAQSARSFRLAIDSGEVTRRDWMPHPDCGCVTVPAGFSADPPESGSQSGSGRPTTVGAAASRG